MLIWLFRALFVVLMASVSWAFITDTTAVTGFNSVLIFVAVIVVGFSIVCIDILSPRKKLTVFAGTFFGLLVGVLIAYALSFVVRLLVEQYAVGVDWLYEPEKKQALIDFITLMVGVVSCYLSISFVLQTKDDFRFIVPYVEFAKETKGVRPVLLDSSVLIDGRIADIAQTGVFDSPLIVPGFVLRELQQVADSADRLKRNRGRRGLDVLARLQKLPRVDVSVYQSAQDEEKNIEVDSAIMHLAKDLSARVLTTDFGLNKVAQVSGVQVINVNDLANALKAEVLPGETLRVRVVRAGEESNQGVGFFDDGTMVVVEHGKNHIGSEIEFVVTNTRQTSAGKMIFGRMTDAQRAMLDGQQVGESAKSGDAASRDDRGARRDDRSTPQRRGR